MTALVKEVNDKRLDARQQQGQNGVGIKSNGARKEEDDETPEELAQDGVLEEGQNRPASGAAERVSVHSSERLDERVNPDRTDRGEAFQDRDESQNAYPAETDGDEDEEVEVNADAEPTDRHNAGMAELQDGSAEDAPRRTGDDDEPALRPKEGTESSVERLADGAEIDDANRFAEDKKVKDKDRRVGHHASAASRHSGRTEGNPRLMAAGRNTGSQKKSSNRGAGKKGTQKDKRRSSHTAHMGSKKSKNASVPLRPALEGFNVTWAVLEGEEQLYMLDTIPADALAQTGVPGQERMPTVDLTAALARNRSRDGIVIVTWANYAYLDFLRNWVHHLNLLDVDNFLIGAPLSFSLHRLRLPSDSSPGCKCNLLSPSSCITTQLPHAIQHVEMH
jgi:hypothetical protein